MNTSQPGFWIAIGVGGSLVATLSAVQQYRGKDIGEAFRPQPVVRDFCIGAFLTAILYMFLPESFETMVSAGQGMVSDAVSKATTQIGGNGQAAVGGGDIELQIGPARF